MHDMARPSAHQRLFVAAYPPPSMVHAWRDALDRCDLPAHRATPIEQVHLTLHFIGDTPVRVLDETIESVRRSGKGLARFDLTPARFITLPERGRKRLIAVETDAHPTLMEIHTRLVRRLARAPRSKPSRAFRPHLTMLRFQPPVRIDELPDLPDCGSFSVDQLLLMRSTLKPTGAEHRVVKQFALDAG